MGIPQFNENLIDPRKFSTTLLCANRDNRQYRNNIFTGNEVLLGEYIYDNKERQKHYDSSFYNELIPPFVIIGSMLLLLNIQ